MNSNRFRELLNSKISQFVYDFSTESKKVFCDESGSLIHPAEFGTYREKIVKELLRTILPQRLSIGTGFIITSNGSISTQCDIIIYDKNNAPLIEDDANQAFFPIECVVAIGEIKSDISTTDLKKALLKLQLNKELRDEIENCAPFIFRDASNTSIINTKICEHDSIVTFLICNTISELNNPEQVLSDTYEGKNQHSKHNLILSINDGTFLYTYNNDSYYSPIFDGNNLDYMFYKRIENNNEHIVLFLNFLYTAISSNTVFIPLISNYIKDKK